MATAALSGCGEDALKTPRLQDALPQLPLPPNAETVGREGGEEALLFVFRSSDPDTAVAKYYRIVLPRSGWNLISDQRSSDGGISIYAERNGPPIWIAIRPDTGTGGSIVRIAGAVTAQRSDTLQAPSGTPSDTVDVR